MMTTKDFSKFSPSDYLKEYYCEIGRENKSLLKFFHEVYTGIGHKNTLLEIGGGPTIYQLISASSKVTKIIFSEFLKANREEIKKWMEKDSEAFNWDRYFEFVLKLENKKINKENLEKIKNRLRNKIKEIIRCDVYQKNPLEPKKYKNFDIISVNFVPESITDNEKEFILIMKNISSLLRTKGILVMTLLKGAKFYKVGKLKFPGFSVDERYIKKILSKLGYQNISIQSVDAEHNQGYEGLIFLTAIKRH